MEIEIIKDAIGLERLKPEWEASLSRDYGKILGIDGTGSWEWNQTILKEFSKPSDIRFIRAIDENKNVAVIPLLRAEVDIGIWKLKILTSIHQFYSGRAGLIVNDPVSFDFKNLFSTLSRCSYPWNMMRIKCVDGALDEKYVKKGLISSGIKFQRKVESITPFIKLDGSWEKYLLGKSKKFRSSLKYYQNKLNKLGVKRIVEYKHGRNTKSFFSHIMEIEKDSWKEIEGTSITKNQSQYSFYRRLLADQHYQSLVRGYVLYIDEIPIAYNLGILSNGIYCCLKTSFKKSYKRYSPGIVLIAEIIKRMYESGIKYYDFMGVFDEHKRRWTDTTYKNVWYEIYQKNPIGLLLYFKNKLGSFFRQIQSRCVKRKIR